ncbi:MAG: hypothetical protein JST14_00510 [Bacteroidetes bacterium]|nr:hypothetical protein [Bacteroidota bacterium]
MHKLLFIIVLLLLDINEPGYAQGKEDVLILFVNEPLPPGAVKLGEKKVDEAYDCYTVFEENVA